MIINIRGTNGSGKTALARKLIGPYPAPIELVQYDAPTKKEPYRQRWVEGWGTTGPGSFLAIGSYKQGCGGMDTIPSFELQQKAVKAAALWEIEGWPITAEKPEHIVCEGVLASTVAGSWLECFRDLRSLVIIAYLDTPLKVCLERITARQIAAKGDAREIKVDLVADKIRAINATRAKFNAAGIRTITLRYDRAQEDLMEALGG